MKKKVAFFKGENGKFKLKNFHFSLPFCESKENFESTTIDGVQDPVLSLLFDARNIFFNEKKHQQPKKRIQTLTIKM